MIYQNVWHNKVWQMSLTKAKTVFKSLFALKPKRPRVKDAENKWKGKMLGLIV
jgi:hypothetical protein